MDEVEVFELSTEQWNAIVVKRMKALNITENELIQKHKDGRLSSQEFKLWMIYRAGK